MNISTNLKFGVSSFMNNSHEAHYGYYRSVFLPSFKSTCTFMSSQLCNFCILYLWIMSFSRKSWKKKLAQLVELVLKPENSFIHIFTKKYSQAHLPNLISDRFVEDTCSLIITNKSLSQWHVLLNSIFLVSSEGFLGIWQSSSALTCSTFIYPDVLF